jgi:TolA-binding protein
LLTEEARVEKGTVRWLMAGGLVLVGACVLQTETVTGPKPEPGVDPALVAQLQDKISQLEGRVGDLQGQIDERKGAETDLQGQIDALKKAQADAEVCPREYTQDATETVIVLCKSGSDEIVRVGIGAAAFWIDRFEASVWSTPDGTAGAAQGVPFGVGGKDYPTSFPENGQFSAATSLLFARSQRGVTPSRFLTWFQAQAACAASGKRLPTNEEWQLAAAGTPDPTQTSDGSNGKCLTGPNGPRATGAPNAHINCASAWGAEDMIGNLSEWTLTWQMAPSAILTDSYTFTEWGPTYGEDRVRNISSVAYNNHLGPADHVPAAVSRGGSWDSGTGAGVFDVNLGDAPTVIEGHYGFRCVIPR